MGMKRSVLKDRRRRDAEKTKAWNHIVKTKERARRDARMVEKLKAGNPPYSPAVASWLSRKLDKRADKITPEEIRTLVA